MISVFFNIVSEFLKTLKAWITLSIKVTSMPTLIYGKVNVTSFRMIGYSKTSISMLKTT
jgi:hypothetical protein